MLPWFDLESHYPNQFPTTCDLAVHMDAPWTMIYGPWDWWVVIGTMGEHRNNGCHRNNGGNNGMAMSIYLKYCTCAQRLVSLRVFSCDQAALWMVQSVCPSVCLSVRPSVRPSVCHTFLTMFPSSYHHEIFRSYYQWQKWRPCKRSRSEVKGQSHRGHDPNFRFRTVTPVWIHIWWWNDTYSLMLLRRGALLFFKVIRQISRSHGAKIAEFDPDWAFPDCNSSLNSPMATKWCTKLEVA